MILATGRYVRFAVALALIVPVARAAEVFRTGQYFLRTVSEHVPDPTRWLVLDFSERLDGSECPGLDTKLKAYPGRNPDAFSPEDPDACIDQVMLRFSATKAFAPGAEFAGVGLVIDGPDLVQSPTNTGWSGKYYVDWVNPLTVTHPDAATAVLETMAGLEQAELWTVHPKTGKRQTLLGTYSMPFQVTVARVP